MVFIGSLVRKLNGGSEENLHTANHGLQLVEMV
jgi:hypothetical protein